LEYLLHIVVLAALFATLALSLDLLVGWTGILSFAHAAFFAIGAYSSAILTTHVGASFLTGVGVGLGVAVLSSLLVSLPALRLAGDEFVLTTFAFQMIAFNILNNWMSLTEGPLGIAGIPAPTLWGHPLNSSRGFVLLALFAFGATTLLSSALVSSPFGRVLAGIRDDEGFTRSLGKRTLRFKMTVIAVSSAFAALSGSIYAHYTSFIDPTSFSVDESILIVCMVVIGGSGTLFGPSLGAVLLVVLPEALRFLGLPDSAAGHLRQIIYGAALVLVTMVRPRGLGRFSPPARAHDSPL
jgi:branched-chain amino acid transport system permease protein